jgi:hypothetical protein
MKYSYLVALTAVLLTGCWDETNNFLAATNECRREMAQSCHECDAPQGGVLPNLEASKFYALCMERQGYSMGITEAQRCLEAPSLDCYGVSDKVTGFWDVYISRVNESLKHISELLNP